LKHSPVHRSTDIGSRLIDSDGQYPPKFDQRLSGFWSLAIEAAVAFHYLLRKSESLEDAFSPEILLEDSDNRLWLRALFEFSWNRPDGGSPKVLRKVASLGMSTPCEWQICDIPQCICRIQNGDCFFSVIGDAAEVSIQLLDWLIPQCDWSLTGIRDSLTETRTGRGRACSVQDKEAVSSDISIDHAKIVATGGRNKVNALHRRNSEELFKSAMRKHHKYQTGGSVLNFDPVSARQIEQLTDKGISDSTACRLLRKHFGSIGNYRKMCATKAIGPKLVILLGDGLHAFGSFDSSKLGIKDRSDSGSNE